MLDLSVDLKACMDGADKLPVTLMHSGMIGCLLHQLLALPPLMLPSLLS